MELHDFKGSSVKNCFSFPHHASGNRWNNVLQKPDPFTIPWTDTYVQALVISSTIFYYEVSPDKVLSFNSPLMTFLYIFPSSFTLTLFLTVSLSLSFINVLSFILLLSLHFYHLLNLMLTNSLDFYFSDLLTSFLSTFWVFFSSSLQWIHLG